MFCIGASAILVRRHGIYVWGDNWQKAKAQYVIESKINELILIRIFF